MEKTWFFIFFHFSFILYSNNKCNWFAQENNNDMYFSFSLQNSHWIQKCYECYVCYHHDRNNNSVMHICKCFPLTLQIIFIYTGRHPAKMTIGCKIMHLLRYAKMHTQDLIKSDIFYDNSTSILQLISHCVDA